MALKRSTQELIQRAKEGKRKDSVIKRAYSHGEAAYQRIRYQKAASIKEHKRFHGRESAKKLIGS